MLTNKIPIFDERCSVEIGAFDDPAISRLSMRRILKLVQYPPPTTLNGQFSIVSRPNEIEGLFEIVDRCTEYVLVNFFGGAWFLLFSRLFTAQKSESFLACNRVSFLSIL